MGQYVKIIDSIMNLEWNISTFVARGQYRAGWWLSWPSSSAWSPDIMTSRIGNTFRVTGPLWGESTGDQWIPLTKAGNADFYAFFDVSLNK